MNAIVKTSRRTGLWILAGATAASSISAWGQSAILTRQDQQVESARAVLTEIMAVPAQAIPRAMFHQAYGVAIVPNVVKGGLVVGVRHGQGVLLIRDANGGWTLQFITLTGGSVGWQVGVQSADVILVFKTPGSIQGLMNGKMTIGADASASAGPVGRNAAVATDAQLRSEIFSYSRSRGLFAGVALDGSSLQIDQAANAAYYQRPMPAGPNQVPASAVALINQIAAYCDAGVPPAAVNAAPATGPTDPEVLRLQLVDAAQRLQAIVDPQWQAYLALPPEVLQPAANGQASSVAATAARYDSVQADPRYAEITGRTEFQVTHQLLRQYLAAQRMPPSGAVSLPPPPQR